MPCLRGKDFFPVDIIINYGHLGSIPNSVLVFLVELILVGRVMQNRDVVDEEKDFLEDGGENGNSPNLGA